MKIHADQFRDAMNGILKEYSAEVGEKVATAIAETAEEASDELHTAGSFNGKKYRASWTYEVKKTALSADAVVFNKKHYRLTHLLEFGHAKQNGGRTRAFTHIAPINDKTGEKVLQKLERML